MAIIRLICIVSMFILCRFKFVQAAPNYSHEYPHLVTLNINNYALYTLSSKFSNPVHPDNVATVLESFLSQHHVTIDRINVAPTLKSLKEKIKWMVRLVKSVSNSSRKKGALLEKWRKSKYELKVWHRSGSPTKRKVEELEEELGKTREELETTQKEKEEASCEREKLQEEVCELSNPKKSGRGKRGKGKQKNEYSKRQKKRHQTNVINTIKMAITDLTRDESYTPVQVKLLNEFDEEVVVDFGGKDEEDERKQDDSDDLDSNDLDEIIFILDHHNVANRGYHALAQKHMFLPRAHSISKRKKQLNSKIEIKQVDGGYLGAFTSIKDMVVKKLEQEGNDNLIENGNVRIKLSGDGTRVSCKQSFVNISITFPDEDICMSEHGDYLLAVVKCPEKKAALEATVHELIEEFESLLYVEVNGQHITIDKYLGGDLKFLNEIMGISSFSGKYSCLWCHCSSSERFDMTKHWSCTNVGNGARTIESIIQNSGKRASDPTKLGCMRTPLFRSVPVNKVVVDTLHLCLRICDQLVSHLVSYLRTQDNIVRISSKTDVEKCGNLQRFCKFINEDAKITDWKFFVNDGQLQYRSFRGPEQRKLMNLIDLDSLIPFHPKLQNLKKLWKEFPELLKMMDRTLTDDEIDMFESSARAWVSLYYDTYCSTDITPYMHVLACHVPESMRLHGNISHFCQQGLEKANDLVTKWYHRSTNFGSNSMAQLIAKQHRLQVLRGKFQPKPRWNVQCSSCNEIGHNKRTCTNVSQS